MKRLCTVLLVLFISGCVATGPLYQAAPEPKASDALIYIYRPGSGAMGGRTAYFFVNEVSVADLSNDGYTWFHVPAGEYTLKHTWQTWPVMGSTVQVRTRWLSGNTYFYRLETSGGIGIIQWRLSRVPANEALTEISSCKLQPAFDVDKVLQQATPK
jgi:hypothetical protein